MNYVMLIEISTNFSDIKSLKKKGKKSRNEKYSEYVLSHFHLPNTIVGNSIKSIKVNANLTGAFPHFPKALMIQRLSVFLVNIY